MIPTTRRLPVNLTDWILTFVIKIGYTMIIITVNINVVIV